MENTEGSLEGRIQEPQGLSGLSMAGVSFTPSESRVRVQLCPEQGTPEWAWGEVATREPAGEQDGP